MNVGRYYTIGAVAPDLGALGNLEGRLREIGAGPGALLAVVRRRDVRLVRATLPDVAVWEVKTGLSRRQWFEFASFYLAVTAVSVLMGAVHLPTGLAVQGVMTVLCAAGLILYHRRPPLRRLLLEMGLPGGFVEDWEEEFASGFALALAAVPEELFEEVREAFEADPALRAPRAVDRRPVLWNG
ncbi:hypothetical protein RxyAA322_00090 [Rubrobacter xylanophilus]|uniref:Uncharacterized protein n=1 Tax=Rubrobacter xylanophilus TaxID=49319 RepID=A0A510HFY4_9ACTN|nr:hypothetical protein [Rubrobacter xylanophilus]BBL78155.1 hypothetical protein RxyAA322_00090 [Rubrobacter xylanophilus]